MSAVSIAEAWPARGRPFTVEDLDRLPDDGRRYELLDGVLVVSPRPNTIHQLAATRLATLLDNACPGDLCVLAESAVQLTADTEFDPDVVVVRQQDIGGAKLTSPAAGRRGQVAQNCPDRPEQEEGGVSEVRRQVLLDHGSGSAAPVDHRVRVA